MDKILDEIRVGGHPLHLGQKKGLATLAEWLPWALEQCKKDPTNPPIFRMYGLAGCGKTTVSIAIKMMGFSPLYIAFTNRAVAQLVGKGSTPAATCHSVLYEVEQFDEEEKVEHARMKQAYLDAVMAGVPPEDRPPMPPSNTRLGFKMREPEELRSVMMGYKCIVVDEASMIGERMGQDLKRIGLPIIGVGDPGQLKPVGDRPFFDPRRPEVLLTHVLRTDGDILDLAAHVRRGGSFTEMPHGEDFEVARKANPSWFDVDQVLCGIHDKRRELNKHIRKLGGFEGIYPQEGEKICVVQNHKTLEMTNGSLWTVTKSRLEGDYVVMDLVEFAPRKAVELLEMREEVQVHVACFMSDIRNADDMGISVKGSSVKATWGGAITVHKAQGSEWNSVLLFDDGHIFKDQIREWRYTGATRAAKKLYVVSRH